MCVCVYVYEFISLRCEQVGVSVLNIYSVEQRQIDAVYETIRMEPMVGGSLKVDTHMQ